jgi:hypothetical protein
MENYFYEMKESSTFKCATLGIKSNYVFKNTYSSLSAIQIYNGELCVSNDRQILLENQKYVVFEDLAEAIDALYKSKSSYWDKYEVELFAKRKGILVNK